MVSEVSRLSLGQLLAQGGWTMWPIYACSVVALAVFVQKWLALRAARLSDLTWVDPLLRVVREGDYGEGEDVCRCSRHPGTRVACATLRLLRERPEHAEAEARRVGSLELAQLEKNLPLLSFIAQTAPLLGLLGTVLGMVDLFLALQGAENGAVAVSTLSGGIWKALLTTAAGLGVAVPTLAAYSYLASRADRFRMQLNDVIQQLLVAVPRRSEG